MEVDDIPPPKPAVTKPTKISNIGKGKNRMELSDDERELTDKDKTEPESEDEDEDEGKPDEDEDQDLQGLEGQAAVDALMRSAPKFIGGGDGSFVSAWFMS